MLSTRTEALISPIPQTRIPFNDFIDCKYHSHVMQKPTVVQRGCLFLLLLFVTVISVSASPARGSADALDVDFKSAISRGDLDFTFPATRSEEGMPVGNGRMGSLVWTTPSALKFQINRCDVFGVDASSVSFPHQPTRLRQRLWLRGYQPGQRRAPMSSLRRISISIWDFTTAS